MWGLGLPESCWPASGQSGSARDSGTGAGPLGAWSWVLGPLMGRAQCLEDTVDSGGL